MRAMFFSVRRKQKNLRRKQKLRNAKKIQTLCVSVMEGIQKKRITKTL